MDTHAPASFHLFILTEPRFHSMAGLNEKILCALYFKILRSPIPVQMLSNKTDQLHIGTSGQI